MSRGRTVNSVFPSDKCLTRRRPRTFDSSAARAVRLSGSRVPHANADWVAVFELGFGISARKLVVENKKKRMARNILARHFIFLL